MAIPHPDEVFRLAQEKGVELWAIQGNAEKDCVVLYVPDPIGAVPLAEAIRERWGCEVKMEGGK